MCISINNTHCIYSQQCIISKNSYQIHVKNYIFTLFSFIFSDPALGKCFRCMVIYEKHFNVLQYKESKYIVFSLCSQISSETKMMNVSIVATSS